MEDKASEINKKFFEEQWNTISFLKLRFQYFTESAKKSLHHAIKKNKIAIKNKKVLDVGFGKLPLSLSLDKSIFLYGTELSDFAIISASEMARRKGFSQYQFLVPSQVNRLPFDDESFDIVICSHIIEHLENDEMMLVEVKRVLKKDGQGIILIPMESNSIGILSRKELRNPEFEAGLHYHVWKYNFETFTEIISSSGLKIVYSTSNDAIVDWRLKIEPLRDKIRRKFPLIDLLISGIINIPLSILPYSMLRMIDTLLIKIYNLKNRQGVFVVTR